jgi:hypothetical protein
MDYNVPTMHDEATAANSWQEDQTSTARIASEEIFDQTGLWFDFDVTTDEVFVLAHGVQVRVAADMDEARGFAEKLSGYWS